MFHSGIEKYFLENRLENMLPTQRKKLWKNVEDKAKRLSNLRALNSWLNP